MAGVPGLRARRMRAVNFKQSRGYAHDEERVYAGSTRPFFLLPEICCTFPPQSTRPIHLTLPLPPLIESVHGWGAEEGRIDRPNSSVAVAVSKTIYTTAVIVLRGVQRHLKQ